MPRGPRPPEACALTGVWFLVRASSLVDIERKAVEEILEHVRAVRPTVTSDKAATTTLVRVLRCLWRCRATMEACVPGLCLLAARTDPGRGGRGEGGRACGWRGPPCSIEAMCDWVDPAAKEDGLKPRSTSLARLFGRDVWRRTMWTRRVAHGPPLAALATGPWRPWAHTASRARRPIGSPPTSQRPAGGRARWAAVAPPGSLRGAWKRISL